MYSTPPLPLSERTCQYCLSDNSSPSNSNNNGPDQQFSNIDDEFHLFSCPSFANQQRCLFGKVGSIIKNFHDLTFENKVKTLLCPYSLTVGKIVNKYIKK